jgi:hypothetical protein
MTSPRRTVRIWNSVFRIQNSFTHSKFRIPNSEFWGVLRGTAPRSESDQLTGLHVWSLATFRTTSFMIGVIISLHVRGSLPGSLRRLDTSTGFGLFLVIWATTWLATRRGLLELERSASIDIPSSAAIVMSTIVAGAWNGLYVFAALVLGFLAASISTQGPEALRVIPVFAIGSVFGGTVAFTIGAIAGLLYGVVEVLLLGACGRLYRWATSNPT